ncbi:hypothetical protein O3M35_010790 [Rhynocoris fuscipes]|uniref:Timeless C-terminal domain-containing protein n=1 Tax=Rhynocoris fuscipes TaxID=488301 RepID=A0AAW1D1A9_9HEMI
MDLIKRFASAKMIGICILLLKTFDTNKELINHCVAKMLHRIAWDCKLPAMLFQATLFCIFQKILMSDDPKFKELADLAKYTVRKFSEVAQTNKKVFVELLFFKTPKDAFEIESGYGSYIEERQKSKLKASKVLWEEHEEEELKRLYEEYMQNKPSEESKFDEEEASDEERSDSSDSDDDLSSSRIEEEPLLNLPLAIIHLVEAMHTHSYLSEGLKWIKASFQECLDDLDDEPSEVPLLPLSADSILSIDNKQFQQFLKAIKICSPQQQEVYWRIPASWKDIDFVNRISLLEILLSHDEDELSSYSDELNLPIKKITGESCDIDKLLEESNHRNLLNNSEVNVDPSLPSTSSNNFASENFDDIIADHCRRALDNELLDNKNENITSNFSKKSKNKFKNDSSDSENELSDNVNRSLNVNDKTEDAFDKLLGKHNSKSNLNENRKKKTSKRIIQDNSSDEENEGSESVKKSLKINDNTEDAFDKLLGKQNSKSNLNENRKKKTSKRIIQDNSSDEENEGSENVEKSLKINNNTEDAFDKLLGKQSSKSNLNENRKKKTSKRIIQDNSSDEENVIVKTNDTPKLKIDSDDDETEKLPKKSIRKLESDSDEEESNIPSAELIKNVQKLTNGEETITENIRTDSKRLRSSDEEDNEDVLPKNKSKKRVVIESDED